MGGGFDREEFREAYGVKDADQVPWARPGVTRGDVEAVLGRKGGDDGKEQESGSAAGKTGGVAGAGPPSAEVVAAAARRVCEEHRDVLVRGGGKGEVWYY
jgi:hypothetical protein